ncbi:protein cornichon homolog 4 isoform X1 [Lampetra planeri]
MWDGALFLAALVICCFLIFLTVYFIITLSDLECDYLNATACCSRLNKWVLPDLLAHAIITVLMLVTMHWLIFLYNLPLAMWNIYRYLNIPSGNMGLYDPTEIHNRGQLKSSMKEAMVKLGYQLVSFFIYLYRYCSYSASTVNIYTLTCGYSRFCPLCISVSMCACATSLSFNIEMGYDLYSPMYCFSCK